MRDLGEQGGIVGGEEQRASLPLLQLHAPIPRHEILDVAADVIRQRVLPEPPQRLDDLWRRQSRGCRIPERKRRNAVSMNVLRTLFELGKGGNRIAGFVVRRVVDLDENGA